MKKNYTLRKSSINSILFWCFLLLSSYCITAQSLNFTIDTAIDTGTTITETIIDSGDTYVLTIDHLQNVEELDNLGGGDLIFFLGSGNATTPFMLSITKNGELTNFKLNSIDYDTLGAGTIAVANQDDEIISAPTAYGLGSGTLVMTNPNNAFDITEIKIIPSTGVDLNNFGFHNISVDILDALGVDESSLLEKSVSVFPNPSNGDITIKNSVIALEKVIISDLNGRVISTYDLNGNYENQELKLSSLLSTGLYMMTIFSENASTTKKLIIK